MDELTLLEKIALAAAVVAAWVVGAWINNKARRTKWK